MAHASGMDTALTLALVAAAPWLGGLAAAIARVWDEDASDGPAADGAWVRVRSAWAPPFVRWRMHAPVWRRPVFELGAVAVAVWTAAAAPMEAYVAHVIAGCVLGWLLLWLAAVDAAVWRLPDPLTAVLALAGFVTTAVLMPDRLRDHAIGAVLGYGVLRGLAAVYERARGRPGLGLGDAKLLGAIGAWLGWRGLPLVAVCASAMALLALLSWGLLQRARGAEAAIDGQTAAPFGPFLAAGCWLTWWWAVAMGPPA